MSQGDDGPGSGGRKRRRGMFVGIGGLLVILLIAGVWATATVFESPEQRAARALPPPPGALLTEVRSGALERSVSTTATITLEKEQAVPVGMAASGAGTATASVVTAASAPGSVLSPGVVIMEVNGRPRLATSGAFRYYRDLSPGMSGPDVRQLQLFLGVVADGVFGSVLENAVRKMYTQAGFATVNTGTPTTGPAEKAVPGTTDEEAPRTIRPALVVPAAELLVIERFPAYVVSAPAVGDLPADGKLTVESGGFIARADVPLSFAHSMRDELPVTIGYQGQTIAGAVHSVVDAPGEIVPASGGEPQSDAASADQKRVSFVLATDGPIDFSWRGREVLVTAVVATAATDSLVVPSIAVVTDRGGAAHVRKRSSDGTFIAVPITEIATLDGKSAITPVTKGALVAGDTVRTG